MKSLTLHKQKRTNMDIQTEKLHLIEWLARTNDNQIIRQLISFQKSSQEQISNTLTSAEKIAVNQGLKSIAEGKVHTHESVMESTKEKYPNLFK